MVHVSRMWMALAGCLWLGMAVSQEVPPAADIKVPPEITTSEGPIIEIKALRLGNDFVSYEVSIYSDGTVRFLGKPDESQRQVGVGEHYAHIPLVDLRVLQNVLKRVDEKLLSESRAKLEAIRKAEASAKMPLPLESAAETPPPIVTGAPLVITLEELIVGNFSPGDKVNIYADGTMHFDNGWLGHRYDKVSPEELQAWQRAFESIQPAIVPQPPEITLREPPVIVLESLKEGDMYVRYKVEIYGDGTVHYYGKPGGKYGAIGDHYSRMSRANLKELLGEFKAVEVVGEERKLDFFDLQDDYTKYVRIHDVGSSAITLSLNGRSKRVKFYGSLAELEGRIWRVVNLNQWLCVPPPPHEGCLSNK
jgi:hypothetical protein